MSNKDRCFKQISRSSSVWSNNVEREREGSGGWVEKKREREGGKEGGEGRERGGEEEREEGR